MACPTSQAAIQHIMLRHREEAEYIPSASVGQPAQQLWARNACPLSSALGSVRWRAADYVLTLKRLPVLFEERNLSAHTRARCLCEFPAAAVCTWHSNATANLCLRETSSSSQRETSETVTTTAAGSGAASAVGSSGPSSSAALSTNSVISPCDCTGLIEDHAEGTNVSHTALVTRYCRGQRTLNGGEWLGLGAAILLLVFVISTTLRQLRKSARASAARRVNTAAERVGLWRGDGEQREWDVSDSTIWSAGLARAICPSLLCVAASSLLRARVEWASAWASAWAWRRGRQCGRRGRARARRTDGLARRASRQRLGER